MKIKNIVQDSISTKQRLLKDESLISCVEAITKSITNCFENDGKVLFCGNGGSAADAQHLAAEFSGRFYMDREPLNSEALHVNTSYLTAVGNDYSFDEVYARIIKAKGRKGDVLVGLSTSGDSINVVKAMSQARKQGLTTVGFTGESGGELKNHCDFIIQVPSKDTPRIQECHIMVGHIICEIVEETLFNQGK